MEQLMNLIIALNLILFIGLMMGVRWWQKRHGKLTEKKFALILTTYFSFSFITTLLPLLKIRPHETVLVDFVFLLLSWGIGYPWILWLYRQFNSPK